MTDPNESDKSPADDRLQDDTHRQADRVPPLDEEISQEQARAIQHTANVESDGPVDKEPPA